MFPAVQLGSIEQTALTVLTTAAGMLVGAELHLYQNDFTPTPGMLIGDFDEADYSGYAEETVTWNAVTLNDAGQLEVVGQFGEFRPSSSLVTNAIWGCYLTAPLVGLVAAARFTNGPLPMVSTLSSILAVYRLRLSNPSQVDLVS